MARDRQKSDYQKFLKYPPVESYRSTDKKLFWIPHKEHGFVPGEILSGEAGKGSPMVKLASGEEVEVKGNTIQEMNPPKFEGIEDMAGLSYLNEASVLHNLRRRYDHDLIHVINSLLLVIF